MKKFYCFKFYCGEKTTIGYANPRTGRMSIAGDLQVFSTKAKRDELVSKGEYQAVSAKEARNLCLGMSLADFNEYCDRCINWQ